MSRLIKQLTELLFRKRERLSIRLLFWILLLSFVFALVVTMVQLYTDYLGTRQYLESSLKQVETSTLPSVTEALWQFDNDVMESILNGLLTQKDIIYVEVIDSYDNPVFQLGNKDQQNLLEKTYPLRFTSDSGQQILVGQLNIVATLTEIYRQLVDKLLIILLTQGIKTFFMSICILILVEKLIISHLNKLAGWANDMSQQQSDVPLTLERRSSGEQDAFDRVIRAINTMQVNQTDKEQQIIELNKNLEEKINIRTRELQTTLDELRETQAQLVESETMSVLGRLVAGFAHELNTPIGISVTAASLLDEQFEQLQKQYNEKQLTHSQFETAIITNQESLELLQGNLRRAVELIQVFKQVAVDQSSERKRRFELKSYLEEVVRTLKPELNQGKYVVRVESSHDIEMTSFPGYIAQVMTNLIMNSVQHGFKGMERGVIDITLMATDHRIQIDYRDDGIGLNQTQSKRVFEPFYTTSGGMGGSGLGMSISYNLITHKLGGTIHCLESDRGAHFQINIPSNVGE